MIKEKLIDLDRDQLDLLHTILNRHIPDKTVWVYGSRVTWKSEETSDLDLAVFGCDSMEIHDLKEALDESDLLISVDVMDWESIPDDFKENIRGKYVVLQEKLSQPASWREVKLGDVAEVTMGQSPKSDTYNEAGIGLPFYQGVVDFGDKYTTPRVFCSSPQKVIEAGDILLSVRAPVGEVNLTKGKCSIGRGNAGLRMKKGEQTFLFYLLKSAKFRFHSISSGSVFSSINKSNIENLVIFVPSSTEQQIIAEVLSSLDDKIDLLHRQNKILEDMAQALFRKWFGNTKEDIWDTGTLSDEFDFTMGQSPPGASYNEGKQGVPLFQGNADFGFRFPTNRVYTSEPKRFAEKFDTLISVRAPVGEQNMAQERCCIGRGVASFRYKKNKEFYTYTYYKMKSLMNRIKQYDSEGTVFGSISKGDFEKLKIVLPPYDLVQSFQDKAEAVDEKITVNQSQIQKLENLQDTLLPGLISGKVMVEH